MKPDEPRPATGMRAYADASAAAFAVVSLAVLLCCMAVPLRWDGLGKLGAVALFFPLHLLPLAVLAAVLARLSWRRGTRRTAAGWLLAATLAGSGALVPTLAIWQQAQALNVELSLREYFVEAGRLNRGGPQIERSVDYVHLADGTTLTLDVWPATDPAWRLRPALVFVHGGAWAHGSRGGFPRWNEWLAAQGYVVFDIEYRLAPPARWRDAVGDVKCALGWVASHAADYDIDPARIGLMGYSAGGHLALLAANSRGDSTMASSCAGPEVAVRAVINDYGPSDLAALYDAPASRDFIRSALADYLDGTPQTQPERYRLTSPLWRIATDSPPTLSIQGLSDRLVPATQTAALDAAFAAAGSTHESLYLPASDHGYEVNWGGFGTQLARARVAAFLARHL